MFILDASVALRWFVVQVGYEAAEKWLQCYIRDSDIFVIPDLMRFEFAGGLARLQPKNDANWAYNSFIRFEQLTILTIPTTMELFKRAMTLTRRVPMSSYDAIYLAHAESLGIPWLTADDRILRRLKDDPRVKSIYDV